MAKSALKISKPETPAIPVHSLRDHLTPIQVLSLDYTNPYDYKREHRHTYYEIMLIERGGGNQLIDFRDYPTLDYSCYIIFPGQVHLMNRKESTGKLIQFTDDSLHVAELAATLKQLSLQEDGAILFENNRQAFDEVDALFSLLKNNLAHDNSTSRQAITHLLHALIWLALANRVASNQLAVSPGKKLLLDFYALLEKHYTENRGVQFYVQQLATTDKKLSSATRNHAGLSPIQVIHNRLLLEAKRLLLFEQTSHKEIAFQLGFDSPASFSAFVKSKTGHPPSELTLKLAEIHK